MLVSEYLSVFTQLYLRKWGELFYQRIMQPLFKNTRTVYGGGGYLGMVGRFHGDDPHFCLSHLIPEIRGHKVGLI